MKLARIISIIFHPILIPISGSLLYFISIPNHIPQEFALRILGIIFITTYIIPLLLLYFLKKVKLIQSFYLESINERKFPILFFIILSLLLGKLLLQTKVVDLLAISFFGSALALSTVYLLFFKEIKTSLHALGISGLIGFISFLSFNYKNNLLIILIILIVLFGIIASSRLKLKAHSLNEIFIGFSIGILSQLITYSFYFKFLEIY